MLFYFSKHQSILIYKAILFFHLFYSLFLCSTSFCFSSSERFLYRSRQYCSYLFFTSSEILWNLLNPFIGFLVIFSRWFFSFSYIWKKKIYRKINIKKWFKMFDGVNMINFFMNHKKVLSKSLKNRLNILKIMFFCDTILFIKKIIK